MWRGRFHRWAFWVAIGATTVVGVVAARSRPFGPYSDDFSVQWLRVIDRGAAGYGGPPPYNPVTGLAETYDNRMGHVWVFSYFEQDDPHWPGGQPTMGPRNPVPPMVRRSGNYGVPMLLVVLALMIPWGLVLVPYLPVLLAYGEPGGAGFDVETSAAAKEGMAADDSGTYRAANTSSTATENPESSADAARAPAANSPWTV